MYTLFCRQRGCLDADGAPLAVEVVPELCPCCGNPLVQGDETHIPELPVDLGDDPLIPGDDSPPAELV